MKIIKRFFCTILLVVGVVGLCSCSQSNVNQPVDRRISNQEDKVQYEAVFEEFDEYTISTESNTTYFVGKQFVSMEFLNEIENLSVEEENELINQEITYEFSYDYDNNVVTISATLATWALRLGVSVYNYFSANAYQVAKDAYPNSLPIHDEAKVYPNIHGMYFNHWHLGNRSGGHSFYGAPLIY